MFVIITAINKGMMSSKSIAVNPIVMYRANGKINALESIGCSFIKDFIVSTILLLFLIVLKAVTILYVVIKLYAKKISM